MMKVSRRVFVLEKRKAARKAWRLAKRKVFESEKREDLKPAGKKSARKSPSG